MNLDYIGEKITSNCEISVLLKHVFLFSFKAPSEKIPRLLSTCPGGEKAILIIAYNYVYINIELGKKQRPPFHTNKPVYIYIYIYSLRTHRLSAEGLTRNYHLSVCLTRVSFADSDRKCIKHIWLIILVLPCDGSYGMAFNHCQNSSFIFNTQVSFSTAKFHN